MLAGSASTTGIDQLRSSERVLCGGYFLVPPVMSAGDLALPLLSQVCDDLVIEHRDGARGSAITMHFDLAADSGEPVTASPAAGSMIPARPR